MTIQEAAKVVYMIHTAYPADRKATVEELADRIDLWGVFFADYSADEVMQATKAWILASSYMPTPKEIKEACDTRRKLSKHLANAFYITGDEPIDPKTEAKLDALWASIQDTTNEADI